MGKSQILVGQNLDVESLVIGGRVLLVSPPVYDYRLDWFRWHHPTGLLQIATLLNSKQKDIRLVDCLYTKQRARLPRLKISTEELEGYKFNRWHLGLSFSKLRRQIKDWLTEGWKPDTVLITGLNSVWWESTKDTVAAIRAILPEARVVLGGVYPTVQSEHAAEHSGADVVVIGSMPEAVGLPPDLSVYQSPPYSTGIFFYENPGIHTRLDSTLSPRPTAEILGEILEKARGGVWEFVFFDEVLHLEHREAFGILLDEIARAEIRSHFVLAGNVSPQFITQDLAKKLRQAKVTRIFLRCNLEYELDRIRYSDPLWEYERAVQALFEHKVCRPREENLAAMLVVGLPYEDLEMVCERLIRLAHIVGSVILVPFQYVPGWHSGPLFERALGQNGSFSPEKFNSKLFPLARLSEKKLEEYIELIRLAALLNSKYRSKTFDFLGDSLAARLFRESIRTEGWNPFGQDGKSPEVIELTLGGDQNDRS